MKSVICRIFLSSLLAGNVMLPVIASEQELNLYTARHYQTDESLYSNFTIATGIKINRIEGKEDELFERLRREGNASPADIFITVDAARLQSANDAGLFEVVNSNLLEARIPAQFRDTGNQWFGMSYRARIIAFAKDRVKPEQITSYLDLASPKFKGKLCVRSGGHVYNRTLMAAMISHYGEDKAQQWAEGIVANLARNPTGGDTDQIRAVAAGECDIAIANHYYYARLSGSAIAEDQNVVRKVGIVFPDQMNAGTHVNISGGGMLKHSPNKEAAIKFLEYLTSDEAQLYFANGNNEWPVVRGLKFDNPQLKAMGDFKVDTISASILAKETPKAQRLIDKAGWK